MRLRLAPVAYKVCTCKAGGFEYEGSQCPECGATFDPRSMQKVVRDRLILVDVDPPHYMREQRFRCRNAKCRNYYQGDVCPLCNTGRPQRPTVVWTRRFFQTVPLNRPGEQVAVAPADDNSEAEAEEVNDDE